MRAIFTAFAKNTVFANILLLLIFMGGYFGATRMVRETFPETRLDTIQVVVAWPGADPEDVEEGISRKIEEAVDSLDGVKQYTTVSDENAATAIIEVHEDADVDDVYDRVNNAVNAIQTFPEDAERPVIEKVVVRLHVAFLALSGDDLSERELKEWAERTKEALQALPEISRVELVGARDYEISIEVSEARLREYGLTFDQVTAAVRANSLNAPGGTLRTDDEQIRLRTIGRNYTAEQFAQIVVFAHPNGDVITLDRIADVRDTFSDDPIYSRLNGETAVSLMVTKTSDQDALRIKGAIVEWLDQARAQLPKGLEMTLWGDASAVLQARISLLVRNGIAGLILVFIILWLFLDLRLAVWASMGMPICIAGALFVIYALGYSINMISLFAMITVLGIIVDDAIVVGEAIYVARKNGAPPLRAAVDGTMEVGMPVIAAVITTIVAFMPMLYTGGLLGKMIVVLPVVVIAALLISLVECLAMLPAHLSHLPDPKRERAPKTTWSKATNLHKRTNEGLEWFAEHAYGPFLRWALRWRWASIALAFFFAMASWGLVQGGFVDFIFFPKLDGDRIIGDVTFPEGTPLHVVEAAVEKIGQGFMRVAQSEETASGDPLVENVYTLAGAAINSRGFIREAPNVGSVNVELLGSSERGLRSQYLLSRWQEETGDIAGAESVSFSGQEAGLPGAAIEIWLMGNDLDAVQAATDELKAKLNSYAGIYQAVDDFRPGKQEIKLRLKQEARALGLTLADLAQQIQAGYFGQEALRVQRGREDIRVQVRYTEAERGSLADFERIRIRAPGGIEVPLQSVAELSMGPGSSAIRRTDGMRRISVEADVDHNVSKADRITGELKAGWLDALVERHPGVRYSLQGDEKNEAETFGSLYVYGPLAILAIYIIIATLFRSYIQPAIILFTVPLGVIGATFGHVVLGYDITSLSVFGVVALSGVVVNDAIVLIERINAYLEEGGDFVDSVVRGGIRRFRAIFLTTISTVGGLTPLILETDFQARIMIPMAISIAAGELFATLLTLVYIPCLYYMLNDVRCALYWLRRGEWPDDRAALEPARGRKREEEAQLGTHPIPAPQPQARAEHR